MADSNMSGAQEMLLEKYQPMVESAVDTLMQISSVAEKNAETSYQTTVSLQDTLVYAQLGLAGGALLITLFRRADTGGRTVRRQFPEPVVIHT